MNKFAYKAGAVVATGALLTMSVVPAAFASTVKVHGNGHKSDNTVKLQNKQKTDVTQKNETGVVNLTGVFQNTGANKANNNTGKGDKTVSSGNAKSTVKNTTKTGSNKATVDPCGCGSDTDVTVSGNGSKSDNKVTVDDSTTTKVTQTNETIVVNGTLVGQNTGANTANGNTGKGDTSVDSGNANSKVTNDVTTGGNVLNP